MRKEVYAEDIERFLATLEGIASVRVSTTQTGEIDRVYVTAERAADARAVRGAVAAALVSTYALPVEPSRIQVTLFREGLRSTEIPRFRVTRIEETVSPAGVAVAVRVAWARGGEEKAVTGRARGPAGPAHRLRVLAAATLDAVRETLEPAHRKAAVQQASFVALLDRPVAVAVLAIPTAHGREVCFGVAPQVDTAEAMVAAALDAVSRWLLKAASAGASPSGAGRRERLEAMRRFVRANERPEATLRRSTGPSRTSESPAPGELSGETEHAATGNAAWDVGASSELHAASDHEPADVARDEGWIARGSDGHSASDSVAVPGAGPAAQAEDDPDILVDLAQIRPAAARPNPRTGTAESALAGGAEMAVQHEPAGAGAAPPRGHPSMEEALYRSLIERRTQVHLRCRDGYELPRAVIKEAGTYVILLETPGGTELVFKHAIISIRMPPTDASGA
jgi:sRNA-binding regulator protein Hfq